MPNVAAGIVRRGEPKARPPEVKCCQTEPGISTSGEAA